MADGVAAFSYCTVQVYRRIVLNVCLLITENESHATHLLTVLVETKSNVISMALLKNVFASLLVQLI